jgi:DNA-binding transcriptional ArsR family regulator
MRMHADSQVVAAPPDEQIDLAVEVFRMLADSTRIRLLHHLSHGECSVNDLAAAIGKGQTAVSQHLAKLRLARLVQSRRQGNQVFYRVDSDHVRQLVEDALHNAEHAFGGIPAHHQQDDRITRLPAAGASQ